jgi:hypothetical protein
LYKKKDGVYVMCILPQFKRYQKDEKNTLFITIALQSKKEQNHSIKMK